MELSGRCGVLCSAQDIRTVEDGWLQELQARRLSDVPGSSKKQTLTPTYLTKLTM